MVGSNHIYTCNIMAISLKEQLRLVKEITYHSPVFNKDYYEDSDLNGAGQRSGIRMFYDFYAMELLWAMVGSGASSKAEREKQKSLPDDDLSKDIVGTKGQPARTILRTAELKLIDDVYDQVTRATAKNLINYIHLAVVQEFQYLISQSNGWSKFRQSIVASYNKNKTMTKQEFRRICNKYIPKMALYPDTVKRLLKYSKYYSEMHTSDDKDPFDVTRPVSGKEKQPELEPSQEPSGEAPAAEPEVEPEPTSPSMMGEPDTTDYTAEPTEVPPGADYDEEEPLELPKKKDPSYSDEEDYWKKKKELDEAQYLKEEKINPSKIKKVYAAIQKAGVTFDDIEKAYNYVEWGAAYGGPRWGAGALAMLKLMRAKKIENPEDLAHIIDHIYDLQHNTGSLLNKGPMYVSDEDLNRRFRVTHVARFLPFVSPMIKAIILRYLKYVHGDPSVEGVKDEIINKPAEQLTPEETQKLTAEGFQQKGLVFRVSVNFVNKKKEQVSGVFYEFGKHGGKYTVNDNFNADVQVYDTFDQAFGYVMGHKQDFLKSGYSMHSPPATQSEKMQYVSSHTKIKLAPDREQQLLTVCKMGWRAKPNNQYYKAYFTGGKRFQMFAFNDGSYLCTFNDTDAYKVFNDWDNAFNYCKSATDNALPYPDEAGAKASMTGATATGPATAPAPQPKEYYLEPTEMATIQTLVAAKLSQFPSTSHTLYEQPNGMISVNKKQAGVFKPLFAVGKKMNTTFGKPFKIIHYIGYGGQEDWSFKNWNDTLDFLNKNIEELAVAQSLASQIVHPTPSAGAQTIYGSMQLPPNPTSAAAYTAHAGLGFPPKHSIRLTKEDEDALKGIGFNPKLVGQDVWYIHKTANDTVKFYPNNESKILFTGKTKMPVVKKSIPDMLTWLPQYYTDLTKQSPFTAPVQQTTPSQAGVKAGSMFEGVISAAGFQWNPTMGKYMDGPNEIVIAPYPKSTVTVGGATKAFSNLPALASFLKNEYPELKKKVSTVSKADQKSAGLTDEEFKLIKDLTTKWPNLYSVKRKKLTSKVMGETPYIAISKKKGDEPLYTVGKTAQGQYVLYNVIGQTWDSLIQSSSFEPIYDRLEQTLNAIMQMNATALNKDQKEWIEFYVLSQKPYLTVNMWNDGTVGVYDKNNKQNPGDPHDAGNPLFVTSKMKSNGYTIRYFLEDWGAKYSYHSTETFEEMANYIKDHFEELTALSKPPPGPGDNINGDLVNALHDGKFKYTGQSPNAEDGNVYDNPEGTKVFIYHNGTAAVYHKGKYHLQFNTHFELLQWLKNKYGTTGNDKAKLDNLLKELNYHDIGEPPGHDGAMAWGNQYDDTVFVYADGTVAVQPMWGNENQHALPFGLDSYADAMVYLKRKQSPANLQFNYLKDVLGENKFHKVSDNPQPQMGGVTQVYANENGDTVYLVQDNGGVFQTNDKKVDSSYLSLIDMAYVINQYYANNSGVDPEKWSIDEGHTGDDDLDSMLKDAGFTYQGSSPGNILAMNFVTPGGAKLKIYDDGSSSHTWAPSGSTQSVGQSVGFNGYPDLKEFLKNVYASKPTGGFPGKKELDKSWGDLWDKLQDYGFEQKGSGVQGSYKTKTYKHPNGTQYVAYDDGHGTYIPVDPKKQSTYNFVSFVSFVAAEDYLDSIYGTKHLEPPKHYYDDLGGYQQAYSIPLTEDDDFQMRMLGWVYVSDGESQQTSAYVHKFTNKTIVFYNKAIMPMKPTAIKYDENHQPLLEFKKEQVHQVIEYLKKHPEKMSEAGYKTEYSKDYYKDVGPDQNYYTIRLKKEHDQIMEDHGWVWLPVFGSMPLWYKHCITGMGMAFYNVPLTATDQAPAKLLSPDGAVAQIAFGSIPEALAWVKGNTKKQVGGAYSMAYYSMVGPDPTNVSIRLTYNDEQIMLKKGFKWVPSWVGGKPNCYSNILLDRKMMFFNKGHHLLGFKAARWLNQADEVKKEFESIPEALKFIEGVDPYKKEIDHQGKRSILTKEEAGPIMVYDLSLSQWNTPPHFYDDVKFVPTNAKADGGGEIQVTQIGIVRFAIGKFTSSMTNSGQMWYVRHATSQGEKVYSFLSKASLLSFVKNEIQKLLTHQPITPKEDKEPPKNMKLEGPAIHLSIPLSQIATNAGFHTELNSLGVMHEHESPFWFQIFQNGIAWHTEKGSKEWYIPSSQVEDYLKKVLTKVGNEMMADDVDVVFSTETKTRQEKVFDRILRIARRLNGVNMSGTYFDKIMEATGFVFNEFYKCYMNEELFQAVVVVGGFGGNKYRIYWVNKKNGISHGQTNSDKILASTIGPKGSIVKSGDSGELEMQDTGQQPFKAVDYLTPSGETYKTHDQEYNSSLIKLNQHDEQLLLKTGFQWVPQENQYYKHIKTGDVAKFYDSGKAEVWNKDEGTTPFENVPHALKYIVLKYLQSPWTAQDYDQKPTDDTIDEIKLNEHDTSLLKTLGFEWDEKSKKYIKFVKSDDTPALQEAKKKKKEDPNQGQLSFDPPKNDPPEDDDEETGPFDHYEIIWCYNTGDAIWEDTDVKDGTGDPHETKEGKILKILSFVWNRWKHDVEQIAGVNAPKKKEIKGLLSNHNYNTVNQDKVKKVVKLYPDDAKAIEEIGFKFTEEFGYPLYVRGEDENFAAYNDNTSHYTGNLATQQHGDITFASVVEGLQFLLAAPKPSAIKKTIVPKEEIGNKMETIGFISNDKGYYVQADIDPTKQTVVFYEDGDIVHSYYNLGTGQQQSFTYKNFDNAFQDLKQFQYEMNNITRKPDSFIYGKRAPEITHKILTMSSGMRWNVDAKAYVRNWDSDEWEAVVYGYDGDKYAYYRPSWDEGKMTHKLFKYTNPQAIINAVKSFQHANTEKKIEKLGYQKLNSPITPVVVGTNVLTEYYKHASKESILVTSDAAHYGFYSSQGTGVLTWEPYQKFHNLDDAATYLTAGFAPTPAKPAEMPYTGHDYSKTGVKAGMTQFLQGEDHKTMESMGFYPQTIATAPSRRYIKGKEMVAFYGNGGAKYWANYKTAESAPFSTVKGAMEFLWAKHKPTVKESTYKTYMIQYLD